MTPKIKQPKTSEELVREYWLRQFGTTHEAWVQLNGLLEKNARPLAGIASEIERDWSKVSPHARPYLNAMFELGSIHDRYGLESGSEIVTRFLCNASAWRGETARRIKDELNGLLKG